MSTMTISLLLIQRCLGFPFLTVLDFLSACVPLDTVLALESMETMDLIAFAAILDLICPLFGRGLLPLKLPAPILMVLALLLIAE